MGSKPGVGSVAKTVLENAKMAAETKEERMVKDKSEERLNERGVFKDTK